MIRHTRARFSESVAHVKWVYTFCVGDALRERNSFLMNSLAWVKASDDSSEDELRSKRRSRKRTK